MYAISECAACVVVTFTLSALLFALCIVLLTIKDGLSHQEHAPRAFPKAAALFGVRPAAVVARHKTFGR